VGKPGLAIPDDRRRRHQFFRIYRACPGSSPAISAAVFVETPEQISGSIEALIEKRYVMGKSRDMKKNVKKKPQKTAKEKKQAKLEKKNNRSPFDD